MTAGIPYLRKRRRCLALAILPVLVLRALIPFGFMPVASGGTLSIEFCPGEGTLPPGIVVHGAHAAHLAHAHHGAHHPGLPGEPADSHHAPCLFALSAAPALTPAAGAPTVLPPAATPLAATPTSRVSIPAIVRAQSPRGPPLIV